MFVRSFAFALVIGLVMSLSTISYTVSQPGTDCSYRVRDGDTVMVVHRGLHGDKVLDTNLKNKETGEDIPLEVLVGKGQVLKGMEQGLTADGGMCIGERRAVTIPPHLGYEDPLKTFRSTPFPKGADIVYEMEVKEIRRPSFFSKVFGPAVLLLFAAIVGLAIKTVLAKSEGGQMAPRSAKIGKAKSKKGKK
eukprot:NODE_7373_length_771_cov_80.072531_g7131_i0.p1 GENE.NODE_7373_length_771_cov_80.072531_g7131_i0~~NODE_7373_length_771_cov_80.072531_g7131_i0.p1  ORF type:complete len:209 (+),score=50.76 NODE_7373_length_771_cov_80.072531_g7131_i0:54-629(+)